MTLIPSGIPYIFLPIYWIGLLLTALIRLISFIIVWPLRFPKKYLKRSADGYLVKDAPDRILLPKMPRLLLPIYWVTCWPLIAIMATIRHYRNRHDPEEAFDSSGIPIRR